MSEKKDPTRYDGSSFCGPQVYTCFSCAVEQWGDEPLGDMYRKDAI